MLEATKTTTYIEDWPDPPETEQDREWAAWEKEQEARIAAIKLPPHVTDIDVRNGTEGPWHDPYGFVEILATLCTTNPETGEPNTIMARFGIGSKLLVNGKEVALRDFSEENIEHLWTVCIGLSTEDAQHWYNYQHRNDEEDPMGPASRYI